VFSIGVDSSTPPASTNSELGNLHDFRLKIVPSRVGISK
jgi:hypothetical protein